MSTLLWSAYIIGLVGNVHCLGMCGPIALAVPVKQSGVIPRVFSIVIYNTGRIIIYTLFGVFFGWLGNNLNLFGFQQYLSIVLGSLIIVSVLFPYLLSKIIPIDALVYLWIGKIKNKFGKSFSQRSYRSTFTIGLLNGLLPCGLVYMAIAGAVLSESWQTGAAYMALFGIGTLPVMFAIPYFGRFITNETRLKLRKFVPVTMIMFGLLLILRGSNLGIPYVSPQIETEKTCCTVSCH